MALQLRALSAFLEDPTSVLSMHIGLLTNACNSSSTESDAASGYHRQFHLRGTLKNLFKRAFN